MKVFLWSSFLLPLASAAAISGKVNYDGYKLFRVSTAGNSTLEDKLAKVAAHVLNPGRTPEIDILVAPDQVDAFNALNVESTTLQEDFGSVLALEGPLVPLPTKTSASVAAVPSASWFNAYHPYADHLTFLRDLQSSFPNNAELFTAGTSVNGRPLQGIHIWGSGGKGSKPAVIWHGNVHAREWITSMTVEYMTYQLLTKYSSDSSIRALVDKFDYYIIPVVNPDGFVYTQTNERLWRKNRQTRPGSSCVGRDINRNWPYKWDVAGGASTDPCSETFKGQVAGDAPENQGLVALTNRLRDSNGISVYIDFHSYGQYILWPYGYDCSLVVENTSFYQSVGSAAASAIANAGYNTRYTTGPSCSTLYATTGSSVDYLDGVGNAEFAVTIEMRDTGRYGFALPANQILPNAVEVFAGVRVMLQRT